MMHARMDIASARIKRHGSRAHARAYLEYVPGERLEYFPGEQFQGC